MRKRIFCVAIVALIVLGLSSQGFCMANRPSDSKKVESIQKISGKISGYDQLNSRVTITTVSGTSVTVKIDRATKISKSGKWIKMSDIRMANVVTADYETIGGDKIARTIIVQKNVSTKATTTEKKRK